MIADRDADIVFVTDTLERRFAEVHRRLAPIFRAHGVAMGMIQGTVDVRCCDNLPIPGREGRFVQFRHEPDYLDGEYRHLRADGAIGPSFPGSGSAPARKSSWTAGTS